MTKLTGNQKAAQFAALSTTTRQILGRTTVPAAMLHNMDLKAGTAEVHIDGVAYDAVLVSGSFKLTGDYTTI